MSAERIADRVRALSGGKLDIAVYAAGEVVPAFEALTAELDRWEALTLSADYPGQQ
jgi:TRAP-type mannitol/chloroaromatic compound transport system substrate-binding protein